MALSEKVMSKDDLCSLLREQYRIFYAKKNLYDRWSKCNMNLYIEKKSLKSKAPLVLTIIITVSLLPVLLSINIMINVAYILFNSNSSGGNVIMDSTTYSSNPILLFISIIISLLLIITPTLIYLKRKQSINKKINKYKSETDELGNQLYAYYNSVSNPLVPFECSSPYVLWEIYEIVRVGRANTIMQAIRQYELDAREKIELTNKIKNTRRRQVAAIAATAAVAYYSAKPDKVDIYI